MFAGGELGRIVMHVAYLPWALSLFYLRRDVLEEISVRWFLDTRRGSGSMEVPKELFHMGNEWFWRHLFWVHDLGSTQPDKKEYEHGLLVHHGLCVHYFLLLLLWYPVENVGLSFQTQAKAWGFRNCDFWFTASLKEEREEHGAPRKAGAVWQAAALSALEFLGLSLVLLSALGGHPFSYPSLPGMCQGPCKTKKVLTRV